MADHVVLQVTIVIFVKIDALSSLLNLPPNTSKLQLEKAISEYIIAFGELVALYKRNK